MKIHYKVKVYIYTKHINDMLVDMVLCLPQMCKINMVKGRFELFKSSMLVRNTELGKQQIGGENTS